MLMPDGEKPCLHPLDLTTQKPSSLSSLFRSLWSMLPRSANTKNLDSLKFHDLSSYLNFACSSRSSSMSVGMSELLMMPPSFCQSIAGNKTLLACSSLFPWLSKPSTFKEMCFCPLLARYFFASSSFLDSSLVGHFSLLAFDSTFSSVRLSLQDKQMHIALYRDLSESPFPCVFKNGVSR